MSHACDHLLHYMDLSSDSVTGPIKPAPVGHPLTAACMNSSAPPVHKMEFCWHLISQKHSSEHQLSIVLGFFMYFKHLHLKNSVSSKILITSISFQRSLIKPKQILNVAFHHHAECFHLLHSAVISDCYLSHFSEKHYM